MPWESIQHEVITELFIHWDNFIKPMRLREVAGLFSFNCLLVRCSTLQCIVIDKNSHYEVFVIFHARLELPRAWKSAWASVWAPLFPLGLLMKLLQFILCEVMAIAVKSRFTQACLNLFSKQIYFDALLLFNIVPLFHPIVPLHFLSLISRVALLHVALCPFNCRLCFHGGTNALLW